MIIVEYKTHKDRKFIVDNKLICSENNDYIESIEYINNEFDDIIFKQYYDNGIHFVSNKGHLHNPIGPAFYPNSKRRNTKEEYWIDGRRVFDFNLKEKAYNYYKIKK